MIEKRLVWVLLLISQFTFSQIKGVVKDSISGKPIPYVNIWVENENNGTTSDENGNFILNILKEKRLVFSMIGYKSTTISSLNNSFLLQPISYELNEVYVNQLKFTTEIEIGNATKMHHKHLSGDKPWIYGKLFNYETQYEKTPFLKKIIFYSDSESKAKLKIRVFNMKDSLPDEDLLSSEIIVDVKKGMKRNEIDVSKYKIKFQKTGIVIGLEWMIIEENKFIFTFKDKKSNTNQEMISYSPSLVINYLETENSYRYQGGRWIKSKKSVSKENDKPWHNKTMTPAINLILTN